MFFLTNVSSTAEVYNVSSIDIYNYKYAIKTSKVIFSKLDKSTTRQMYMYYLALLYYLSFNLYMNQSNHDIKAVSPVIYQCFHFTYMWNILAWQDHFLQRDRFWHIKSPPIFIELSVSSHESQRSCICVLVVSILPLSAIFRLDFDTVPTVWYFISFYFILYLCMYGSLI